MGKIALISNKLKNIDGQKIILKPILSTLYKVAKNIDKPGYSIISPSGTKVAETLSEDQAKDIARNMEQQWGK